MHWCYYCYVVNPGSTGPCIGCGRPVEGPSDLSYDDRLIWTLRHPDGDRAVLAAQTGARGGAARHGMSGEGRGSRYIRSPL